MRTYDVIGSRHYICIFSILIARYVDFASDWLWVWPYHAIQRGKKSVWHENKQHIVPLVRILFVILQACVIVHPHIGGDNTRLVYTHIIIMAEEKAYSRRISRDTLEKTRRGIHNYIIVGKRYRNPKYTALQLSEDIGVNTRYLSAAIQKHYGCNFATLVNKLRIEDAKEMLSATECTLTMEDLSYSAGFSTRQSFYNAFSKYVGMTPSEYRERVLRLRTQDDDAFEILDF